MEFATHTLRFKSVAARRRIGNGIVKKEAPVVWDVTVRRFIGNWGAIPMLAGFIKPTTATARTMVRKRRALNLFENTPKHAACGWSDGLQLGHPTYRVYSLELRALCRIVLTQMSV